MIEYLFITVLGVFAGLLTGITPGIHPNTVIFVSLPFYFSESLGFLSYMAFISGVSVSHTFHDFLPAIFLGTPESETALSSLPGADMAFQGRGLEAFRYTLGGGMFSILVFLMIAPFLFLFLEPIYSFLSSFMAYILIFFLLVIIFNSDNFSNALIVAILSGFLGLFSLSMPVNQQYVLVPVFTGLFAVPAIIDSFQKRREIPKQKRSRARASNSVRGGIIGGFAGLLTGIFPGLGAGVSTSFLTPLMDDSRKEFLASMGAVNTSDILMSFLALLLIDKARSGASVALKAAGTITAPRIVFLAGASFFAAAISVLLASYSSKFFVSFVSSFDFQKILVFVLFLILGATVWLTGILGLLVLFTASVIGYNAALVGERKSCMAVLLVPSVFFFSSVGIFI